jgi:transposase
VDGEIVVERRRQWTSAEKAALLGEIEATGGRVAVVAQRHGISKSLLYNWRSAWKAATLGARGSAPGAAEFIPLGVIADRLPETSAIRMTAGAVGTRGAGSALAERAGVIEIDLPEGVRVRVDGAIDAMALRRVLAALRGSR